MRTRKPAPVVALPVDRQPHLGAINPWLHTLPSDLFTWDKATRTLIGEASTLEANCPEIAGGFRAAYPQRANGPGNSGFFVRSTRTGRRVAFVLKEYQRDNEGEVTGAVFRPATEEVTHDGSLRDVLCHVFNT